MALVIPPDYYQILIPLVNSNVLRPAAITFGVSGEASTSPPDDICNQIVSRFIDEFGTAIDPNVTIGPAVATFQVAGGERGSVSGTTDGTGSRSGTNTTPPQIAVNIRKRSNRVGRPGRGRFSLPWAIDRDDVQEDGMISPDEVALLQNAADAFLEALETNNTPMVLLHNDEISGSTLPSLVTGLSVAPKSGTQRRRNG